MAIVGVNSQNLDRLLGLQATNGNVFNETDTYIMDGLFYRYSAAGNELVQIEPLGLYPLNFDPTTGQYQAEGLTPPLVNFNEFSGWAHYEDGEYTFGDPWVPTPDVWNNVPNDGLGDTEEDQLPVDYPDGFYDPVTGKLEANGEDAFVITAEFAAKPTTGSVTFLETGFFVGGTAGPLQDGRVWQRTMTFPFGINVVRVFNASTGVHVSPEAAVNGAIFQMRPTEPIEVFAMAYEVYRIHKARGE